ncbi:hypothetical protein LZC95_33925 [Pendulispora brunnea]|uniref:Uncharacterized protein n=1 Tax=Pendulispora brunnea TaxID=2905690 RepID=A0ABZ2K050_9BACT
MRILIVGASKGTGALAVEAALARGHEVTAFARSAEKLAIEHPKLTGWFAEKVIFGIFLKLPYADRVRQEQDTRDKTIKLEKVPSSMSRADVADFLVEAAEVDTWVGKAVQLGG